MGLAVETESIYSMQLLFRRRMAAMRLPLSLAYILSCSSPVFTSPLFSAYALSSSCVLSSPAYALSKKTRLPSFCSRFWTFSQAYAVSGIAPGLIERAIAHGELEPLHTADQGKLLNAEEFRRWAYRTKPECIGKRHYSLMQTGRILALQAELMSAVEKANDYAEEIGCSLPEDWIGRLIGAIHDRERARRTAVKESLEAMAIHRRGSG